MRRLCSKGSAGGEAFTLVEVLLGLLIFSIIAVGLYQVLGGALQLDKKARQIHGRCQDLRQGFAMIVRDLENAVPYPFVKGLSDRLAFEGSSEQMIFFVPTGEGIVQMEYYAGDLDRRTDVKVRRVSNVREIFEGDQGKAQTQHFLCRTLPLKDVLAGVRDSGDVQSLMDGVARKGVRFYYGVFSKDKPGQRQVKFQDHWKDNQLPDVVRIEVKLVSKDGVAREALWQRDVFPVVKGPLI